jgi:hypothetical protein|tara:strand:- start:2497 stop:2808 length:312 start_codon:yes stop_codon:yes gene_type:complete
LFDKLKGFAHHRQSLFALLGYRHHGQYSGLEAVLEHESCTLSRLEVERNGLQSAHVEERLVLYFGNARVMEVLAVHETALFRKVTFVFSRRVVVSPARRFVVG